MATPVLVFGQIATECEKDGLSVKNAERIGQELAKAFTVQAEEVAILRVEKQNLVFVYPTKLHTVGSIPLNTTGSVAARSATSKRPEVINSFAQTKHVSLFEAVELGGAPKPVGMDGEKRAHLIQKMICVPVLGPEGSVGVIEISRKGPNAPAAGPDFTPTDMQKLVAIAGVLAKCFK